MEKESKCNWMSHQGVYDTELFYSKDADHESVQVWKGPNEDFERLTMLFQEKRHRTTTKVTKTLL